MGFWSYTLNSGTASQYSSTKGLQYQPIQLAVYVIQFVIIYNKIHQYQKIIYRDTAGLNMIREYRSVHESDIEMQNQSANQLVNLMWTVEFLETAQ